MKLNQRELQLLPPPGSCHRADAQRMGTGNTSFSRLQLEIYKGDRTKMGGKCEDCEKWEEEMYWSKFKVVHFFSVLTNNFRYQLKFPKKLVNKCLVDELSEINVVTLKGPSGRTWSIQLVKYGSEELYLKKGWEVFVQEHKLKENDVLLFKYNLGTSVFDVLMFDEANFCEKDCKNEASHRSSKEWLNESKRVEREPWSDVKGYHKSKGLNEGRKRVERDPSFEIIETKTVRYKKKANTRSDDDEEDEQIYGRVIAHPRLERQPSFEIIEHKKVHYKKKAIAISDDEEDEEVYGRVIVHPRSSNPLPGSKGKALVHVKPEEVSEDEEVTPVNPLALVLKRKTGKEEQEAFEQAVREGKQRRAPHFVVCMKRSHISAIYYMTVPVDAARKHIDPATKRIYVEMNGKTWKAKYVWKKEGVNSGITGRGWTDFVQENRIKVGDVCLFEITSPSATTSKKSVRFEVSIFQTDEDVL
ncbi:hypothetical protein MKX03_030335 [Papaver bracteatum]|nr:hypothetical protein MKX03_030335 [Papaver bracteatum]